MGIETITCFALTLSVMALREFKGMMNMGVLPQYKNINPIRVLIVDGSQAARQLYVSILRTDPIFEIVGMGRDGGEAVRLVKTTHPDILMIDLRMPGMDGLEATRQIMREAPLPIVLISGSSSPVADDTDITFDALRAGALAVIRKPDNDVDSHTNLIRTLHTMVGVPVIHHWGRLPNKGNNHYSRTQQQPLPAGKPIQSLIENIQQVEIIGIAASTGGPGALAAILRGLPSSFPVPILIVQHISRGFDIGFAEWLAKQVRLQVVMVSQGDRLRPGSIYMAPDDYHLDIPLRGMVILSKNPPYKGLRPSANPMFFAMAKTYGSKSLGLILTGMGDDGVQGLSELHRRGGLVLSQDEASCIVYGMPKEAAACGAVDAVINLEQIASVLKSITGIKTDPG